MKPEPIPKQAPQIWVALPRPQTGVVTCQVEKENQTPTKQQSAICFVVPGAAQLLQAAYRFPKEVFGFCPGEAPLEYSITTWVCVCK